MIFTEPNSSPARLNTCREQTIMFQTAVMEERTGLPWGVIAGFLAFAALLVGAYTLFI